MEPSKIEHVILTGMAKTNKKCLTTLGIGFEVLQLASLFIGCSSENGDIFESFFL